MRTDALLLRLQTEAQNIDYSEKLNFARTLCEESPSVINRLALYNYKSLEELLSFEFKNICEIEDTLVAAMEAELTDYLDAHISGNEEYKQIIRIVSLYLSFITHKPLHPAGLFTSDGSYETTLDGSIVCPLRAAEISKPNALCKYCSSVATRGDYDA